MSCCSHVTLQLCTKQTDVASSLQASNVMTINTTWGPDGNAIKLCTDHGITCTTKLNTCRRIRGELIKTRKKRTKMQDQLKKTNQKNRGRGQVFVSPINREDLTSQREMFLGRHLMRHRSIRFQSFYLQRHRLSAWTQKMLLIHVFYKRTTRWGNV